MKVRIIAKRIVIYFVLIVLAFILQTCLFPLLKFLWAVPNLLLIITFSYGFIYGTTTGIICGFFAGLMMDIFYSEPFGLFILIFSYLGYFSGLFQEDYRNDSLILPLLICFLCDFFYDAAMVVYSVLTLGTTNISYVLRSIVLPEMFFTLLITTFIYQILLSTNKKLDQIDDFRGQNAA